MRSREEEEAEKSQLFWRELETCSAALYPSPERESTFAVSFTIIQCLRRERERKKTSRQDEEETRILFYQRINVAKLTRFNGPARGSSDFVPGKPTESSEIQLQSRRANAIDSEEEANENTTNKKLG